MDCSANRTPVGRWFVRRPWADPTNDGIEKIDKIVSPKEVIQRLFERALAELVKPCHPQLLDQPCSEGAMATFQLLDRFLRRDSVLCGMFNHACNAGLSH